MSRPHTLYEWNPIVGSQTRITRIQSQFTHKHRQNTSPKTKEKLSLIFVCASSPIFVLNGMLIWCGGYRLRNLPTHTRPHRSEHVVAGIGLGALPEDGLSAALLEHFSGAIRSSQVADGHHGVTLRVARAVRCHRQERVDGCPHGYVVTITRCSHTHMYQHTHQRIVVLSQFLQLIQSLVSICT